MATSTVARFRRNTVEAKRRKPGYIIFHRCGDFYEAIDDDARVIHQALGTPLAKGSDGTRFAGIPCHRIDRAIDDLNTLGYHVDLLPALA